MKILSLILAVVMATDVAYADMPAVHGMLLFGKEATYVSHLPMFHSPHDYQLIMKVTLADLPGSQTTKIYESEKKGTDEYFTIVPEVADLTQVMDGKLTSLKASLFKGHFERGGQDLGPVQVHFERIIFASKLMGSQPSADAKFLMFGENGEYFAAHLIKGKPSFDQIVEVTRPYQCQNPCKNEIPIEDEALPAEVSVSAKKPVTAWERLGFRTKADVLKMIYLEEAELSH